MLRFKKRMSAKDVVKILTKNGDKLTRIDNTTEHGDTYHYRMNKENWTVLTTHRTKKRNIEDNIQPSPRIIRRTAFRVCNSDRGKCYWMYDYIDRNSPKENM